MKLLAPSFCDERDWELCMKILIPLNTQCDYCRKAFALEYLDFCLWKRMFAQDKSLPYKKKLWWYQKVCSTFSIHMSYFNTPGHYGPCPEIEYQGTVAISKGVLERHI